MESKLRAAGIAWKSGNRSPGRSLGLRFVRWWRIHEPELRVSSAPAPATQPSHLEEHDVSRVGVATDADIVVAAHPITELVLATIKGR